MYLNYLLLASFSDGLNIEELTGVVLDTTEENHCNFFTLLLDGL